MGYYTTHSLEVHNVKSMDEYKVLKSFMQTKPLDLIYYAFDEGSYSDRTHTAEFGCWEAVKWYTHDDDMVKLSKAFPDMVFRLSGTGEEQGDMWYTYYHNGKYEMCVAKVTFPEPETIKW